MGDLMQTIASLLFVLCLLLPSAATALDELAAPAEPPIIETWNLTEVWTLDNELDEELPLLGVVSQGVVAKDGHVFVLDSQLAHVLEIAPDGSYVRTLGHSGQGPGELEHPNSLYIDSAGRINLIQVFPGKVVSIHRDGTPAGGFSMQGANPLFYRVRECGGHCVASGRFMDFSEDSTRTNESFLRTFDADGVAGHLFFEGTWTTHYDPPAIHEKGNWFPNMSWDLLSDGTLVVAPQRDQYRLEWYNPSGELLRVVEREFTPHVRTDAERRKVLDGYRMWVGDEEVDAKKSCLDTDPAIRAVQVQYDGTIWVRSCYAERELPDGVHIRYDVFSGDGEFLREVRIAHPVDSDLDYWGLLRDGSFLWYRNGQSALDAMYPGMERSGDETEESAVEDYLTVVRLRPSR